MGRRSCVNIPLVYIFYVFMICWKESCFNDALQFGEIRYEFSVTENEVPETIGQVGVSANTGTVKYSIENLDLDDELLKLFTVTSAGDIQTTDPLDREDPRGPVPPGTGWAFTVKATDDNDDEATATVVVTIEDVNDNGPELKSPIQCPGYCILENSAIGTTFNIVVDVLDQDNENGGKPFSYLIVAGEQEYDEFNEKFEYLGTTDNDKTLNFRVKGELDRETKTGYLININALDVDDLGAGDSTSIATIVISIGDENDNIPEFIPATYFANVEETSLIGTKIATLTVIDVDDPSTNNFNFFIESGDDNNNFQVDFDSTNTGANGEAYADLVLAKQIDYEVDEAVYNLRINVLENADLRDQASVQVVLVAMNDNAPVFDPISYSTEILEDASPGTIVGNKVEAEDGDTPGSEDAFIEYSIEKDSDPEGRFEIDEEGFIKIGTEGLDRESNATYKLIILAIDRGVDPGPLTGTATYTVNVLDVNDNPPVIRESEDTVSVREHQPPPEPVQPSPCIIPYDADLPENGPPFTYKVVGPPDIEDIFELYTVDGYNGTVAFINATVELDAATKNKYEMLINISDSRGNYEISTLFIDVISEPNPGAIVGSLGLLGLVAIIVVLVILILIVVIVVVVKFRNKDPAKKPIYIDEDLRENFVAYDEEGGGEEDQDAYDINILSKPVDPPIQPITREQPLQSALPPGDTPNIADFIGKGVQDADEDSTGVIPDSIHVYDFEGEGSSAGSLSSLNSGNSEEDQNYDYLNQWGPRFQKLADMYGGGED